MKYKVLKNLKHDGKKYKEGDLVELEHPKDPKKPDPVLRLLSIGVIEGSKPKASQVEKGK